MSFLETAFRVVLDVSWRASWLIVAVLLLQVCLQRYISARVLCWLTLALAFRLLLPFAVPTGWSPFGDEFRSAVARRLATPVSTATENVAGAPVPPPIETDFDARREAAHGLRRFAGSPWEVAAAIWLAGVVLLGGARVVRGRRFATTVSSSPHLTPGALEAEARRQFGESVRVTVTDAVSTPALLGILRPHLLFPPATAEQLSADELRHVVAHELGHHRRHDLLALRLAQCAAVVHWFNPLAWFVARQVRRDCEVACDESVLAGLGCAEREQYGHTLLRILSFAHAARTPRLALGVVESKQQLKRRIQMIATPVLTSPVRTLVACVATLACVVVSATHSSHAQTTVTSPDGTKTRHVATETAVDPEADNLDQQFPNGIVAVVGAKTITVADVRRELAPVIPVIRHSAKSTEDYQQQVRRLKNSAVKDLIDRELLLKDFRMPSGGKPERRVAAEQVDGAIADRVAKQFGGDQAKFVAYLGEQGTTLEAYRGRVEEDIMYSFMRQQDRAAERERQAAAAKAADHTGKVHLRAIQLARNGRSDAALQDEANAILARFRNGEAFGELAKEVSVDSRRAKGGDWGWLGEKDFRPEFWRYVQPLPAGQVSTPVIIKEGCFLLYVEERG